MDTVVITLSDGEKREYCKGVKFSDIVKDISPQRNFPIIAGNFNGQNISYDDSIVKNGDLILYDINTKQGNKMYEVGLIFLFIVSAHQIIGQDKNIRIRHSIDKGIYCEIDYDLTIEDVKKIKEVMQEKVAKSIPFTKIEASRIETMEYFKKVKRFDKSKTIFYNTSPIITLYRFDGWYNYIIGEVPHDSSVFQQFDLTLIEKKGIVLRFPSIYDNGKVVKYTHHDKYFNSLEEYSRWGKILKINNLGELNEAIIKGSDSEIINLSEMLQDYKLLNIAEEITLDKENIKFVLISGPSSSGKTTVANKIALYLKTLGLKPCRISMDDYFVEREHSPRDENGEFDFENIECVDKKLFHNHLEKLLKGEKVNTPTFDFVEGKKKFDRPIQLKEDEILIIEGLHALNNEMTNNIPKKNKYKVYISPLTFLNIDNDNRISMTDMRLLRRLVRDHRIRGNHPSVTLNGWANVRKGEEEYVFPFQDEADVVFNSSLAYELGVLKTYVTPLLFSVASDDPEYLTAIRLLKLLEYVLPIPSDFVPSNSILREFIGNSYFENKK
ncbi:MAG: nucleoside kinase [bacterium]|nr:nucleoside kinase [bacterium]